MTNETQDEAGLITRLRRALGARPDDTTRTRAVADRLAAKAPPGPALGRNDIHGAARIQAFAERLKAQTATVDCVDDLMAVPAAVTAYLGEMDVAVDTVAVGDDPALQGLDWGGLHIDPESGEADVAAAVVRAVAGISETGTLAFISRPESPPVLNFVAETHIAVVADADIVASYEAFWTRLRADHGGMAETLNFISGPSKTGDIEQTMYYGAHGPRRLHVIVTGGTMTGGTITGSTGHGRTQP